MTAVPKIFDDCQVACNRARAGRNLARADFLFTQAWNDLIDRLSVIRKIPQSVLILGTRGSEKPIETLKQQKKIGADFALWDPAKNKENEATLPFPAETFDAVFSVLDLHTVNDLPGRLAQIKKTLKPGGFFLGNLLGGETLRDLRGALMAAELDLRGGVAPRVAPFADRQQISDLMQRAGFALPVVDSDTLTVHYRSLIGLFHDLRAMGEGNALAARDKRIPPRSLFPLTETLYRERHAETDGLLPVRFEIISMIGWAN